MLELTLKFGEIFFFEYNKEDMSGAGSDCESSCCILKNSFISKSLSSDHGPEDGTEMELKILALFSCERFLCFSSKLIGQ